MWNTCQFFKLTQEILLADDYPLQRKKSKTFPNFVHSVAATK